MKKIILAALLACFATAAYASCTTWWQTTTDGRSVLCTRCCQYGSCNTTCN